MRKLGEFLNTYYDVRSMSFEDILEAKRVHHIYNLVWHKLGPIDVTPLSGYLGLARMLATHQDYYKGKEVGHLKLIDILKKGIVIGDYWYHLRYDNVLVTHRWVNLDSGHWRELTPWNVKFDPETEKFGN